MGSERGCHRVRLWSGASERCAKKLESDEGLAMRIGSGG